MPRIRTEELLDLIRKRDFKTIRLRGSQSGSFYILLETTDGAFFHENSDGNIKEYPKVDSALTWLRRMTNVKEVIVDIELWKTDAKRKH
jgi:hypothetical protein